uniref:Uncharacterized protein n=1 Tax=Anguilla anguilla TaxID=7936 RepID=A0A0E9UZB4_ANGAN
MFIILPTRVWIHTRRITRPRLAAARPITPPLAAPCPQ